MHTFLFCIFGTAVNYTHTGFITLMFIVSLADFLSYLLLLHNKLECFFTEWYFLPNQLLVVESRALGL
jgi:hypothetical protein